MPFQNAGAIHACDIMIYLRKAEAEPDKAALYRSFARNLLHNHPGAWAYLSAEDLEQVEVDRADGQVALSQQLG